MLYTRNEETSEDGGGNQLKEKKRTGRIISLSFSLFISLSRVFKLATLKAMVSRPENLHFLAPIQRVRVYIADIPLQIS